MHATWHRLCLGLLDCQAKGSHLLKQLKVNNLVTSAARVSSQHNAVAAKCKGSKHAAGKLLQTMAPPIHIKYAAC